MEKEIWKPIEGYEEIYQVSNLGRLKSFFLDKEKGKILKTYVARRGYEMCELRRKDYSVHRLVANAFIANPNNYPYINHIDGVKINNNISNLEWCSAGMNNKHAVKNGLRKKTYFKSSILIIKDGVVIDSMTGIKQIKEKGFDYRSVNMCLSGRSRTHKGCTFERDTIQ